MEAFIRIKESTAVGVTIVYGGTEDRPEFFIADFYILEEVGLQVLRIQNEELSSGGISPNQNPRRCIPPLYEVERGRGELLPRLLQHIPHLRLQLLQVTELASMTKPLATIYGHHFAIDIC